MQDTKFILIYSTIKSTEVALIKSLLQDANISFFVSNESLRALYGPADGFTVMGIMVERDKAEEAKELLKAFITPGKAKEENN